MRGVVCLLLHACDLQRGAGRLVPGSRLEHGRDLPRSCHVLWAPSQPCRRLVPISLIRPICVSYLRLLRCTSAACMASWSTSTAHCHSRAHGGVEPGVVTSLCFGVASAFAGQLLAFPLETIARRLQGFRTHDGASLPPTGGCVHTAGGPKERVSHAGSRKPTYLVTCPTCRAFVRASWQLHSKCVLSKVGQSQMYT
eukprot:1158197-Pelagomonas_calceolata.AAC.1